MRVSKEKHGPLPGFSERQRLQNGRAEQLGQRGRGVLRVQASLSLVRGQSFECFHIATIPPLTDRRRQANEAAGGGTITISHALTSIQQCNRFALHAVPFAPSPCAPRRSGRTKLCAATILRARRTTR